MVNPKQCHVPQIFLFISSWGCGQTRSTSGVLSCEGEVEEVLQIHILFLVRLLVKHFGETLLPYYRLLSPHVKNFRQKFALQLIREYKSRQRYALPALIRHAASQNCIPPPAKQQRTEGAHEKKGHFPVEVQISLLLLELPRP